MNPTTFSALAEPNRLHIVELLRNKPRPVGEIVNRLHLHQPQVSKHLKVLADAGLVEMHPVAQQRIYKINPGKIFEIEEWVKKMTKTWDERFDALDKLLAVEKKKLLKVKK